MSLICATRSGTPSGVLLPWSSGSERTRMTRRRPWGRRESSRTAWSRPSARRVSGPPAGNYRKAARDSSASGGDCWRKGAGGAKGLEKGGKEFVGVGGELVAQGDVSVEGHQRRLAELPEDVAGDEDAGLAHAVEQRLHPLRSVHQHHHLHPLRGPLQTPPLPPHPSSRARS